MSDSGGLVAFYLNAHPDDRGRYWADILQWSDDQLEDVHSYIQWVFPLREPSPVNPTAPLLNDAVIAEFRGRAELRDNLRLSFERMACFYGLEVDPGPPVVVRRASNFAVRAREWLTAYNHNHLRITRILKCLATLGLTDHAQAFFACLSAIYEEERTKLRPAISVESYRFWQRAYTPQQ